jgi:hypothetical protein
MHTEFWWEDNVTKTFRETDYEDRWMETDSGNLPQKWFTRSVIQVEFFRVVTPCSVVVGYQYFGTPFCLHLQGEAI